PACCAGPQARHIPPVPQQPAGDPACASELAQLLAINPGLKGTEDWSTDEAGCDVTGARPIIGTKAANRDFHASDFIIMSRSSVATIRTPLRTTSARIR